MVNDKWVWVIGAGIMQLPIIREAKSRGYKVIVSDRNADAPGGRIADHFIQIDTYDIQAHVDIAECMNERPCAVLTAGADVGPTVSAVAEVFGLPAERLDVAAHCRNKVSMRRLLKAYNPLWMPVDWDELSPHADWKSRCRIRGISAYPCVLKPSESSGSKGVVLVKSPWQWEEAIKYSRRFSKRHGKLLIEEFLEREAEVSLDFFVDGKAVYYVNGAYRLFYRKFGIEAGHINPWIPPKEVVALVEDAAEKLGVTFGPFKVDLMKDKRYGWVIMEVATRLSGGFDHMTTAPLATGKDITSAMLDLALGAGVTMRKIKAKKDEYACAFAPMLVPGKVREWKIPPPGNGVVEITVLSKTEIAPLENCTNRPVFVIARGKTAFGALKNAMRTAREIEVIYDA